MYKACLFDIDGTLVDSNDAHAQAWVEAFAEAGIDVEFDRVRRSIGMGGDKLMPAVSRFTEDTPEGKRVASRRREIFTSKHLPRLQPFAKSSELVAAIKSAGLTTVAASSAKRDELHALLRVAGASELLDHATSSDDAEESKPDPDIVHAALQRAGAAAGDAVMIGDTPYDVEAAQRAGVDVVAFRCGGWGDADLRGALAVYDGPWDLLAQLGRSPLRIQRGRL
jgi:phosphoglycolate phosphatase-like HAD superfamily hydrolase